MDAHALVAARVPNITQGRLHLLEELLPGLDAEQHIELRGAGQSPGLGREIRVRGPDEADTDRPGKVPAVRLGEGVERIEDFVDGGYTVNGVEMELQCQCFHRVLDA